MNALSRITARYEIPLRVLGLVASLGFLCSSITKFAHAQSEQPHNPVLHPIAAFKARQAAEEQDRQDERQWRVLQQLRKSVREANVLVARAQYDAYLKAGDWEAALDRLDWMEINDNANEGTWFGLQRQFLKEQLGAVVDPLPFVPLTPPVDAGE